MQVVDDLGEVLLGLVLARDVVKLDALGRLDINLGIGLPHVEHHEVVPAHFVHHLAGHILPQCDKDDDRQHPAEDIHQQRGLLDLLSRGGNARVQQPLDKPFVIGEHRRFVDGFLILIRKQDPIFLLLDLHLADLALFGHGDKGIVIHLFDLMLGQPWHGDKVEEHHDQHRDHIVVQQRLFRRLDFIHCPHFLLVVHIARGVLGCRAPFCQQAVYHSTLFPVQHPRQKFTVRL